ncbi:MAG: MiaB/RimO family radical SAM methylthiotransferase, partial [Eubacteriales bacterium]|nr:MiaB/RimO family radical SAM methylthiotransferase [Eubacteriales bacterium]
MKVLFVSLGCDKNLVDSEHMLGALYEKGFALTDDEDEAEAAVINTCCFIEDAQKESIEEILALAERRTAGQLKALIVTGCMAQRYREEILKEIPEVDAVVSLKAEDGIAETLEKVLGGSISNRFVDGPGGSAEVGSAGVNKAGVGSAGNSDAGVEDSCLGSADAGKAKTEQTGTSQAPASDDLQPALFEKNDLHTALFDQKGPNPEQLDQKGLHSALYDKKRILTTGGGYGYLKIAEGCDKHCTYCVIPSIRGPYRSVPMEKLLEQAKELAEQGVRELILVAQETTLYGKDLYGEKKLPELLRRLSEIQGIEWIRILYCYPEEITEELLYTIRDLPKVVHYLDIPIQHAADSILKKMGRRTNRKELEETIALIREILPDVCIRTTLITGFPGEREEDHRELMDFVKRMKFDRLGVFTYSKEEGTPAARISIQIPMRIKKKRRKELMLLQQDIAFEAARAMKGRELEAIVEGKLVDEDVYVARTYKDAPGVDGSLFIETKRELMSGDL